MFCGRTKKRAVAVIALLLASVLPAKSARAGQAPVAGEGFTPITLGKPLPKEEISKTYPFLKQYAEFTGLPEELGPPPPEAPVMEIRNVAKNTDMVILYPVYPGYCRDTGCALYVYLDEGKGYQQALATSARQPLYILRENGKLSLAFCAYDGLTKWTLQDHAEWKFRGQAFEYKGVIDTDAVPKCPPEPRIEIPPPPDVFPPETDPLPPDQDQPK
jgi:hypothetical protein